MRAYKQPCLFLVVGGLSALANITIFYGAYYVLSINYQLATSIAYLLAVIVHFFGNHFVTFQQANRALLSSLKKYLGMLIVNYLIAMLTMTTCIRYGHVSPMLSICISISITTLSGYLLAKAWVFKSI